MVDKKKPVSQKHSENKDVRADNLRANLLRRKSKKREDTSSKTNAKQSPDNN